MRDATLHHALHTGSRITGTHTVRSTVRRSHLHRVAYSAQARGGSWPRPQPLESQSTLVISTFHFPTAFLRCVMYRISIHTATYSSDLLRETNHTGAIPRNTRADAAQGVASTSAGHSTSLAKPSARPPSTGACNDVHAPAGRPPQASK